MAGTKALKTTPIDNLLTDLRTNPEFRKAERLVSPFYELAVEIINQRVKLGLTQKDLAEKAGTHQSRISKIESGEHDMRLSTLINIAEALGTQLIVKMVPIADNVFHSDRQYSSVQNIHTRISGTSAKFVTQGEYHSQALTFTYYQ